MKQDETLLNLKKLDCYSVDDLKVEFTLNGLKATTQRPVFFYQGMLLVQSDHVEDTDFLAVELAKQFGDPKGLKQFIGSLFDKVVPEKIEKMLLAQNIKDLPEEEKEWFGMATPRDIEIDKEEEEDQESQDQEQQDESKSEDAEELARPTEKEEEPIGPDREMDCDTTENERDSEKTEESPTGTAGADERGSSERSKSRSDTEQSSRESSSETEGSSQSESSERRTDGASDWEPEISPEEAKPQKEDFTPDTIRQRAARASVRMEGLGGDDEEDEQESDVSDNLSSHARKAIGCWGEKYAVKCLRDSFTKKYPDGQIEDREDGFSISINGQSRIQVHWLNAFNDVGEGHDIQVIDDEIEEWIEVKSTKTESKELFPVTRKQWEKAQELGPRFHIYRVFNVGTDNVKYRDVPDPYNLWIEGKLVAYPVSIRL